MQFCLAFLALLLLLPAPAVPQASRAVQRWVALEKARIQFERQRGAGTLNRARPCCWTPNKCAPFSDTAGRGCPGRHGGQPLLCGTLVLRSRR
uniref:DEFENSIN domain-containing protein n=1 Tax=Macrostomum lignano TaxID=282301 RepID=A0A1I8FAP4_9PLAT